MRELTPDEKFALHTAKAVIEFVEECGSLQNAKARLLELERYFKENKGRIG